MATLQKLIDAASSGAFDQVLEDDRDHAARYLSLSRSGGDVVTLSDDDAPCFLVNSPQSVEYVLEKNSDNYTHPPHPFQDLVGRFADTGALLLRLEKGGDPARVLAKTTDVLVAAALAMGDRLVALSASGPVALEPEAKRCFFEIIVRLLYDVDIAELSEPFVRAASYLEQCWARKRSHPDPDTCLSPEQNRLFQDALAIRDLTAERIVREAGLEAGDELTPEQLRYAVIDTAMNGFGAPSVTLCWVFYCLALDDDVRSKTQQEIDRVLAGENRQLPTFRGLTYTKQVILETLRLYPTAWSLGRETLAEDRIGDTVIPAGSEVVISPYAMHRHPAIWEHPERFDPRRFEQRHASEHHPCSFIPFGAGPRRCPAGHMVVLFLQVVLGLLLHRHDVTVDTSRPVRPRGLISLRPVPGVWARFTEL